ncbi:MAG: V-type ATPase 116kDa subunit family protein [Erysipelotrichaceae bacterium]|nr:ATPase V [Erysipelotrichaceae bacterium]MDD7057718.1 V-type ATPase 116kDa subunit family protein [Erysipelotrichaceae bacterium]MDY3660437.1 V-type ATPase 116kDa subunit family protein [Bulleidia sp.]
MAIVKMKYVSVATDESHIDEMVLDGVHSGLLHAVHAADIINEDNGGHLINDENPYSGYLQTLQNFAHSVNYTLDPERAPKKHYTNEEMDAFIDELDETFGLETDANTVLLTPDDEQALGALSECGFERMHACQYLNFGFGRLPRESYKKLSMYKDEIFVHHHVHETPQYVWMLYVTSDSYVDKVRKIFKDLYFEPIDIPMIDVKKQLEHYKDQIDDIYAFCNEENSVHELYPYIAEINEKYLLSGFVKADEVDHYKAIFKDLPSTIEVKDPSEVPDLECPTLLKNNWFAKPFEMFLGMYGVPKYTDFDPTGFMAFTYCLLFGIMFGDLGQGLVLFILGLVFEKKGQIFGIINRCGITSMIFGFLFGSVFGYEELLNPIHQSLFGVREKLFDVMAQSSTMVLLIGAVAIGAVLILTTQCMNIVNRFKHHQLGDAIFSQNGIAGLVFYGGIVFAIVATMLLGWNVLNPVYLGIFIVLPVISFVMKEPLSNAVEHKTVKPEEGWGGYIAQSIFELIDVLLTFVTNSMSYLRVGGFVLSHAGMMLVVMTLVEMTGKAGVAVLIFGNIFVMVLEGLIVGIQTLRLEYYEMFSRYYDAGGVQFNALSAKVAE